MWHWLSVTFRSRLERAARKWLDDDGNLLAASIAYYAVFSLLPLLMLLTATLGVVLDFSNRAQDAQQELLNLVGDNTSAAIRDHVASVLQQIRDKALLGGPLSLLFLLMAALGVFAQLESAFRRIWSVPAPKQRGLTAAIRTIFVERFRAFLLLVGVGVVMIAAMAIGAVLSAFRALAMEIPGADTAWGLVRMLSSVLLYWATATALFRGLPKADVRRREAAAGVLLVAVLWEIGVQALAFWVAHGTPSAYGVVGSLIVLMLWVYVASGVLFLGAEYVQLLGEERTGGGG
jgi:membrane protein